MKTKRLLTIAISVAAAALRAAPWNRTIAEEEFRRVTDEAARLGLEEGWTQPWGTAVGDDDNAKLALDVLNGNGRRAIKEAVALNTGALLYISQKCRTIEDGYKIALEAIDSGKAKKKLEQIVSVSATISAA